MELKGNLRSIGTQLAGTVGATAEDGFLIATDHNGKISLGKTHIVYDIAPEDAESIVSDRTVLESYVSPSPNKPGHYFINSRGGKVDLLAGKAGLTQIIEVVPTTRLKRQHQKRGIWSRQS